MGFLALELGHGFVGSWLDCLEESSEPHIQFLSETTQQVIQSINNRQGVLLCGAPRRTSDWRRYVDQHKMLDKADTQNIHILPPGLYFLEQELQTTDFTIRNPYNVKEFIQEQVDFIFMANVFGSPTILLRFGDRIISDKNKNSSVNLCDALDQMIKPGGKIISREDLTPECAHGAYKKLGEMGYTFNRVDKYGEVSDSLVNNSFSDHVAILVKPENE